MNPFLREGRIDLFVSLCAFRTRSSSRISSFLPVLPSVGPADAEFKVLFFREPLASETVPLLSLESGQ